MLPISLVCSALAGLAPCPDASAVEPSRHAGGDSRRASFQNNCGFDITVSWVDSRGDELMSGVVGAGDSYPTTTFGGHFFAFRGLASSTLLATHRIDASSEGPDEYAVEPCGDLWDGIDGAAYEAGRSMEFERLLHDHDEPCAGKGSAEWSCMRFLTAEDEAARAPGTFGFADAAEAMGRKVRSTEDWGYTAQAEGVPHVTSTGGLQKMRMTDAMRAALYPWFNRSLGDGSVQSHSVIPGGYTNSHVIAMDKVSLFLFFSMLANPPLTDLTRSPLIFDRTQHTDQIDLDNRAHINVKLELVREMRQVLQWWTSMQLRHTSTFGLRIYHRGSMLINHFDRADTHLASAVLQVGQDVDAPDGGWPLEVVLPAGHGTAGHEDARVVEVYLQPGDMVLYEGARIKHGRPMRFKGNMFGNVFTHFAPIDHLRKASADAARYVPQPDAAGGVGARAEL